MIPEEIKTKIELYNIHRLATLFNEQTTVEYNEYIDETLHYVKVKNFHWKEEGYCEISDEVCIELENGEFFIGGGHYTKDKGHCPVCDEKSVKLGEMIDRIVFRGSLFSFFCLIPLLIFNER